MATMEDLIQSLHGNAHISPDLKALQDYLSQTLKPAPLSVHTSGPLRQLAPSRSTSSSRYSTSFPPNSHEPHFQPYSSPLVQTPFPGEDPNQSTSTILSRPYAIRRTSSYGFSQQQIPTPQSEYAENEEFQGDAFAPLVQQETSSSDPWARLKQAAAAQHERSAFSSFQPALTSGPGTGHGVGHHNGQLNMFGRYQSPVRSKVERPPTPPDEDEEMMDAEMVDEQMMSQEAEVDEEHAMNEASEYRPIPRPESAPANLNFGWGHTNHDAWNRGRQKW